MGIYPTRNYCDFYVVLYYILLNSRTSLLYSHELLPVGPRPSTAAAPAPEAAARVKHGGASEPSRWAGPTWARGALSLPGPGLLESETDSVQPTLVSALGFSVVSEPWLPYSAPLQLVRHVQLQDKRWTVSLEQGGKFTLDVLALASNN